MPGFVEPLYWAPNHTTHRTDEIIDYLMILAINSGCLTRLEHLHFGLTCELAVKIPLASLP